MSTVNNNLDQAREQKFVDELRTRLLSKDRKLSLRHERKAEKSVEKFLRRHDEISQHCLPEKDYPKSIIDLCQAYFSGQDSKNRLVISIPHVGDFKTFLTHAEEKMMKLLFSCLVKSTMVAEKLLDERNLDSAVTIVDISMIPPSYYVHRKSIAFLLQMLKTLIHHLPAIATPKIIIVNAPWHFTAFLNFVTKFIKFPAEIVVYSSSDLKWREKIKEHVPENSLMPEFGGTQKNAIHVASLRDSI